MKRINGFFTIMKEIYSRIPLHLIGLLILKTSSAVCLLWQISVTASFLDMTMLLYKGEESISSLFKNLFLLFTLIAGQWFIDGIVALLLVKIKNVVEKEEDIKLITKVNQIPYYQLELSEVQNIIKRIKTDASEKISTSVLRMSDIIKLFIRISGLFFLIFRVSRMSAVLIFASSLPMLYLAVKSGQAQGKMEKEITEKQRYADYLSEVLSGRETACERQLFGYEKAVNREWQNLSLTIVRKNACQKVLWFLKTKASALMILLSTACAGIVLMNPYLQGKMTVGFYISIMTALVELIGIMTMEFASVFDELGKNVLFFQDYENFYRMRNREKMENTENIISAVESIEFREVSFCYPGQERKILDKVSFKLERGKSYALVGKNGAGKTTLVKLLLRLYDSYEGEILVNGIDIRNINMQNLLKKYSVVFQDFCRFPITFGENIVLSERKFYAEELESMDEELGIRKIAGKLKNGYDTELGKIESEEDISGGEWQRAAIARAIIRDTDVQILDEPTAALDPVHESRLYDVFQKLLKKQDKLSLVITHRLGASKNSDCIFVLGDGNLIESGNFEQLMAKRGMYYEMYKAQSKWYTSE